MNTICGSILSLIFRLKTLRCHLFPAMYLDGQNSGIDSKMPAWKIVAPFF